MRWTSFFTGVGALILLDVVIAPDNQGNYTAAGRVGDLLGLVGSAVQHLMSPGVPLVPDLRQTAAAQSSSASTGAAVVPLALAGQGPAGYPTAVPNPALSA